MITADGDLCEPNKYSSRVIAWPTNDNIGATTIIETSNRFDSALKRSEEERKTEDEKK